MTALAAPPTLDTWARLRSVITDAIHNHPRSQQVRIGPSEIGTPCDLCLGRKLAGVPEAQVPGSGWLPTIGTAIHSWLEEQFIGANMAATQINGRTDPTVYRDQAPYLLEQRVDVGDIDGTTIHGSCDLYDRTTGTVVDWKTVGPSRLKDYKASGPSAQYRVQAHLYGRGWAREGEHPTTVAIAFLPRNGELSTAHWWSEPYDEQVAVDALARATAFAQAIRLAGADAVLAGLQPLPGCDGCRRYTPRLGPFDDLI